MRSVMTELLAAAPDDGELDVVELVKWYPIAVICELLGTPRSDWALFSDWTDEIFKIFQFNAVNDEPDILRAFDELRRVPRCHGRGAAGRAPRRPHDRAACMPKTKATASRGRSFGCSRARS